MRNLDYEGSIMSDGHLDVYLESSNGFSANIYHGPGRKINYPNIHTKMCHDSC